MDAYNAHIAEKGIVYARSMYNIQQTVTSVDGHLEVNLECIRPDVEIHYTLNGSNPVGDCLYFSTGGYGMQIGDHFFH